MRFFGHCDLIENNFKKDKMCSSITSRVDRQRLHVIIQSFGHKCLVVNRLAP